MELPSFFSELELPEAPPAPAKKKSTRKSKSSPSRTREKGGSTAVPGEGKEKNTEKVAPTQQLGSPEVAKASSVETFKDREIEKSAPASSSTGAGRSALHAFKSQVKARKRQGRDLELHPRFDQMWVTRRGETFYLSTHRGRNEYEMSPEAIKELSGMVDISSSLLSRMQRLPRVEDCRLLNLLLWAEGAQKESRFRLRVKQNRILSIRSPRYVSLDLLALADRLEAMESEGFKVKRYEMGDDSVWIEILHDRAPIDLSPVSERANSKADFWKPGAVIFNQEDGSSSLAVVPVLFRSWGGAALPVASSRKEIRKRRHRDVSVQDLVNGAIEDLRATKQAPYSEMAERLGRLHHEFMLDADAGAYLDALNLPFPSQEARDATLRRVMAGRPTLYRIVCCAINVGTKVDDAARRFRLAIALGRLSWSRGNKPKKKAPPRASS